MVGAASAQVTIDGQIELGVVNTAAGTQLDAGNGGSQIRFSSKEDLGGGMSAMATMAMRFSPESGQWDGTANNRPAFQGESTVGIAGAFGSVKIGRALPALMVGSGATDPWGQRQQAHTGLLTTGYASDGDNTSGSGSGAGRTDAIHYSSPNVNGFSAMVSAGLKRSASTGTGTNGSNGGFTSYWVSYGNGPLAAGFGSEKNRTGDSVTAYLATYDLGMAKIGVGTSSVDAKATTGSKGQNTNYMLTVPFGAVTAALTMASMKAEGTLAATSKSGIGASYALSKKTRVYITQGATKTKATGATAKGWDLGITHAF